MMKLEAPKNPDPEPCHHRLYDRYAVPVNRADLYVCATCGDKKWIAWETYADYRENPRYHPQSDPLSKRFPAPHLPSEKMSLPQLLGAIVKRVLQRIIG